MKINTHNILTILFAFLGFGCYGLAWLWQVNLEPSWPLVPMLLTIIGTVSIMLAAGKDS